jgi:hypothetical protein
VFFGYYDKTPWSPDGSRVLAHVWTGGAEVAIGFCTPEDGVSSPVLVSSSAAWNWQQGSMTQWLPGNTSPLLIHNAVVQNRLVARIVSTGGQVVGQVSMPIQALHPGGSAALALNYRRLWAIRPEYGYSPPVENFTPDQDPARDGIWLLDIPRDTNRLIVSLAQLMTIAPRSDMPAARHKVNHIMYSPQGGRAVFMHRWFGSHGKFSRLYVIDTANPDPRLLLDERMISHYSWRDENHLLAWARTAAQGDHYHLIDVRTGVSEVVGGGVVDVYGDGHPSYSPDRRWIVTDTYPDRARRRHLILFSVETGGLTEIGRFFAPWRYDGAVRCDLHPRWAPDGNRIAIDSVHTGKRGLFLIDVTRVVAG